MLQPGKGRQRPPRGKAQAHPGVHPLTSYSDNQLVNQLILKTTRGLPGAPQ